MAKDIRPKEAAFAIDTRIDLKLDYDLAAEVGRIILATDTQNPILRALGHQLRSLLEPDHDD